MKWKPIVFPQPRSIHYASLPSNKSLLTEVKKPWSEKAWRPLSPAIRPITTEGRGSL